MSRPGARAAVGRIDGRDACAACAKTGVPSYMLAILALHLSLAMTTAPLPDVTLFDFTADTSPDAWRVQDDVVMGGRSAGHFALTSEGHARFHGEVSLANNGGFSSIVHALDGPVAVGAAKAFRLRVRGDGSTYTFRVKSDPAQRYYHEAEFATGGSWEVVEVPFAELRPVHHGEPVDAPAYVGGPVTNLQLLIGNGREQSFELLVDWIGT